MINVIVSFIMASFVINEYVHLHNIHFLHDGLKCVIYEPIEYLPVIEGSLRGSIYNGNDQMEFTIHRRRIFCSSLPIMGYCVGYFNNSGVIKIFCRHEPNEEHYLRVSYEFGYENLPQKSNWLQEGF